MAERAVLQEAARTADKKVAQQAALLAASRAAARASAAGQAERDLRRGASERAALYVYRLTFLLLFSFTYLLLIFYLSSTYLHLTCNPCDNCGLVHSC